MPEEVRYETMNADEHATDDHATDDHDDGHAHAEESLGPIDLRAWGAALLGAAAGLIVAICFVLTTSAPA